MSCTPRSHASPDEPGAIIPYPLCFESILSFLNDSICSSTRAISRWKSWPLRIGAAFTEANSAIELGRISTPGIETSSTSKGTIGTPNSNAVSTSTRTKSSFGFDPNSRGDRRQLGFNHFSPTRTNITALPLSASDIFFLKSTPMGIVSTSKKISFSGSFPTNQSYTRPATCLVSSRR
jgi:hypothetical protein